MFFNFGVDFFFKYLVLIFEFCVSFAFEFWIWFNGFGNTAGTSAREVKGCDLRRCKWLRRIVEIDSLCYVVLMRASAKTNLQA